MERLGFYLKKLKLEPKNINPKQDFNADSNIPWEEVSKSI